MKLKKEKIIVKNVLGGILVQNIKMCIELEELNKRVDIEMEEIKQLNKEADEFVRETKHLFSE